MSARLERILASIGTPAHVDQETPRETILAIEVRRLQAERSALQAERAALQAKRADLLAKVNAAHSEAETAYLRTREPHYAGERVALELVQEWLEAAGKGGGA